jgi:predicted DNA-binding transcriptional regulator AlpA
VAEDDDPYDLVGAAELASMLGIGRSRADTLTRMKGFPEPRVQRPRLWHRSDVEAWLDANRSGWRGDGSSSAGR